MSKTGVIHVWLYGFIPKVIGSRFRVQGSGLTTPGPDLVGERDSPSGACRARAGFEPMNFER